MEALVNERQWMYNRKEPGRMHNNEEYMVGVRVFLDTATTNGFMCADGQMLCPCSKCRNRHYHLIGMVEHHLYCFGFVSNYYVWSEHGEEFPTTNYNAQNTFGNVSQSTFTASVEEEHPLEPEEQLHLNASRFEVMLDDIAGPSNPTIEDPNTAAAELFRLLEASGSPAFEGCERETELSIAMKMMQWKTDFGISEKAFDTIAGTISNMLGGTSRMPTTYRQVKLLTKKINLGYIRIDVCPKGCMIFYKDDENLSECRVCGEARYNTERYGEKDRKYKRISRVQMFYLPIIPRLQRLFMTDNVAKHMTWHASSTRNPNKMVHPADGQSWKQFDSQYPHFAAEPRNIRLGLCTDGFSPFGMSAKSYSCWPVMVTPYNLPPWLCMKDRFLWLSIIIPGPFSPKKGLDIYLRPLIDDLKYMWAVGVETYDVYRKDNFHLHAALIWTISDFPAYGMLSGWTTQGHLGCPYCMEDTKTFQLEHGRKPCYFDCHRRFLPEGHPYRYNTRAFRKGLVELDNPIPFRSGQEVLHRLRDIPEIWNQTSNRKLPGYGVTHNWTKKSIFWELSYWPDLLIRHNLDVMHVEKNVFDNLFNTMMGVKGKSKDDNNRCRKDIANYCYRPDLELQKDHRGKYVARKAKYCLSDLQKISLLEWVQTLKFPDGYVSALGSRVDIQKRKLVAYKSHDAHVFLEILMQIGFKGFLPKPLWDGVAELCTFFRDCASSALDIERMTNWRNDIAKTLCKLEMYFPPSFFDSMEHLPIHIADEALMGGPVHYRWMYPFERFLYRLKGMATNKSRIEASIVSAYIAQETAQFGAEYLDPEFHTNARRPRRNEIFSNIIDENSFSIFNHVGSGGKSISQRELSSQEFWKATHYVLTNTPEVDEYYTAFKTLVVNEGQASTDTEVEHMCINNFPEWFRRQVWSEGAEYHSVPWIVDLSMGFDWKVLCYNTYKVNNYHFHTELHDEGRNTKNSHIHVLGEHGKHYFGVIEEIFAFRWAANHTVQVVMFKCRWFDPNFVKVDVTHGVTECNVNKPYTVYDPFILAQQAEQVYYTYFPGLPVKSSKGWRAVCKVKPTNAIDMRIVEIPFQYDDSDSQELPTVREVNNVGALADEEYVELFNDDPNDQDYVVTSTDEDE